MVEKHTAPPPEATIARYLRLMEWARRRYTINGRLILWIGNEPGAYIRIERAAWRRLHTLGGHDHAKA